MGGVISTGQGLVACVMESAADKKWSIFMHVLTVFILGIMLAVFGGFSAKSAADMNGLSNFKQLKDSKDPAYSKPLDEAHGYMAGSSATAWIGFAAVVVTIIIIGVIFVPVLLPKFATSAGKNAAAEAMTQAGAVAATNKFVCKETARKIVDAAASTPVLIVTLVNLGVTAFALFMTSLAVRSFLSLRKFKSASASTMSAADKTKLDSANKNTMITMGLGVGAGLIGILGLVI